MDGPFVFHHRCRRHSCRTWKCARCPVLHFEADYPDLSDSCLRWIVHICCVALHAHASIVHCVQGYRTRKILRIAMILGIASSTHLAVLAFANMYDHLALRLHFPGRIPWRICMGNPCHFPYPIRTKPEEQYDWFLSYSICISNNDDHRHESRYRRTKTCL